MGRQPSTLSIRTTENGISFDVPAKSRMATLLDPAGRELAQRPLAGMAAAELSTTAQGLAILQVEGDGWSRSQPVVLGR